MNPFLGQINLFGCNFAPSAGRCAKGQLLAIIAEYRVVFADRHALSAATARPRSQLPDLRSRAPIGFGQGPGLSDYAIGETGGAGDRH